MAKFAQQNYPFGRCYKMFSNNEKYIEAKKKDMRNVYQVKYEVKRKRFGNFVWCVGMIRNVMCLSSKEDGQS